MGSVGIAMNGWVGLYGRWCAFRVFKRLLVVWVGSCGWKWLLWGGCGSENGCQRGFHLPSLVVDMGSASMRAGLTRFGPARLSPGAA